MVLLELLVAEWRRTLAGELTLITSPLMFRPVRNLEVRLAGRARTGFSFMGVNFRYG